MLKRSKTELATLGMGTGSALGRECVEQPGLSRFASDIENPLLVVPGFTVLLRQDRQKRSRTSSRIHSASLNGSRIFTSYR